MDDPYRSEGPAITLGPNKKHCYACASILDFRAELCPRCGVRQPPMPGALVVQPPAPLVHNNRSRTAAGMFALFLGGLGIHKFYVGQIGLGVLYLAFCWTFIPAIVAFVEGIIFLTMSDEEFNRKFP